MYVKIFYFISYTSNILYAFLDLGTGWNVARINDVQEDWFVEQVHLSSYDQREHTGLLECLIKTLVPYWVTQVSQMMVRQ